MHIDDGPEPLFGVIIQGGRAEVGGGGGGRRRGRARGAEEGEGTGVQRGGANDKK